MILYFEIIVFLFIVYYILHRLKIASRRDELIGFLINPMLYFVCFGLLYLLLSNILIGFGIYDVIPTGIPIKVDLIDKSVFDVNLYFFFIFLGYFFSKDKRGLKFNPIQYKSYNELFFWAITGIILILLLFLIFKFSQTLLLLRDNRVEVFDYYVSNILKPYKLEIIVNIYSALLIILLFSEKRISRILVVLPFFAFICLEYLQGGRSIIIRLVIIIYIISAIRDNKTYITHILFGISFIGIVPAISRMSGGNIISNFYISVGEFINTRLSVDYVLHYNISGSEFIGISKYILSIFPSILSSLLLNETDYMTIISKYSDLSYGLAGSVVGEGIFYFGDFYIISALFVIITSKLLYSRFVITRLPLFIVLIIFISNIQNIYRSSFFDFGLMYFYLLYSYLLIFSILLYKKRIFLVR